MNTIGSIIEMLIQRHPKLKQQLLIAHVKYTPEKFFHFLLLRTVFFTVVMSLVFFMLFSRSSLPKVMFLLIPFFLLMMFYRFFLHLPHVWAAQRQRDIDREVIFAGRFLLLKLRSGQPIINAFIEASRTYGIGGKYFKEILNEINTGTPIEEALDNAIENSASRKFSKILAHVNNALRLGIDVTVPLEAVLKEMTQEQLIEIKRYGKKLNSFTLLYMLIAILLPSIGMTFAIVVIAIASLRVDAIIFIAVIFFLLFIQFMFISLFKSVRPAVTL